MVDIKQKMRERIEALLAKTRENGATEEEEMAAMAKAMELIAKHQIDMTADRVRKSGVKIDKITFDLPLAAFAAWELSPAVEIAADVQWFRKGEKKNKFYYIGLEEDIALAIYLTRSLTSFAVHAANEWWNHPGNYIPSSKITGGERLRLKQSFIKGLGMRCLRRAYEEKEKIESNGRSLVPVKQETIIKFMEEKGIKPKEKEDKKRYDEYATASGYQKGAEAQLRKVEVINDNGERSETDSSTERVR